MSSGCNAVLANVVSYTGTMFIYVVVYFFKMPYLPKPIVGCLVEGMHSISEKANIRYVLLGMWCVHFLRRIIEVLFVHIYKRKMPFLDTIGGPVYYWTFALFNSWAIDKARYVPTLFPLLYIGGAIFIIGEFGNAWHHHKLRGFRTKKHDETLIALKTGHVVPHGGFFNLVSCPHYFFEIISWLGFFFASFTLWSLLFLLCTIVTLFIYSNKKHEGYKKEFDGSGAPAYHCKKRLIPFVY